MSRYGLRSRLTGAAQANSVNYWFGSGFAEPPFLVDYLVVAGGGGSSHRPDNVFYIGGGAGGGLRSTVTATGGGGTLETALSLNPSTNYTITVGAGGAGSISINASPGANSVFSTITSNGGGYGAQNDQNGGNGGSGGGAGGNDLNSTGGTRITGQGFAGGNSGTSGSRSGGGGGGAGSLGGNGDAVTSGTGGIGGAGLQVAITGISVFYSAGGGGGGGGGSPIRGANGTGYDRANAGMGGFMTIGSSSNNSGTDGIVILKYPDTKTITIGAGLTGSTASPSGGFKVSTITAGTGNVSWV